MNYLNLAGEEMVSHTDERFTLIDVQMFDFLAIVVLEYKENR